MNKIKLFCTIGPSSLNRKFLKFSSKLKIDLLRINLSHVELHELTAIIKFIKKHTNTNICLDTEGAQIRTKTKIKKHFKKKQSGYISSSVNSKFSLYPNDVIKMLKKKDILDIGFDGLKIQINKIKKNKIQFDTLSEGLLENNKGVHLINRKIKLNYLTKKDFAAIEIAKKFKIKNYALSFTNGHNDIIKFKKILPKQNKIYKVETKDALKNFDKMLKYGDNFLIDRGDLSKDILIENIPIAQRYLISRTKKIKNKNVYVATNFLESMIIKSEPTRAEVNDIYNSLEMGASGLVLAAETAIGKNPHKCVLFINKIYSNFIRNKKKELTSKFISKIK